MLKFIRGKGQQPTAERQKLQKDLFAFRKTVQHGFPNKPTAIAWDPSLRLMIIGTASGAIKVFGRPGVEFYGQHASESGEIAVTKIIALPNEGRVVSLCDDNSLHLWEINENSVIETKSLALEGKLKKISAMCLESNGDHLLLGTEGGNIYLLNLKTFTMSDTIIYQDVVMQNVPKDFKVNPGPVEAIAEQPGHPDNILIGYNRGLMVLWNKATPGAQQTFVSTQQLESVHWVSESRFVFSHNDGSYAFASPGNEEPPTPTTPYGPFPCKAITKIVVHPTEDDDELILFSGGMQRSVHSDRHTITVKQEGKNKKHVVFDFTSKVIDFFTILPKKKQPQDGDEEKDEKAKNTESPEALIVLAEEELIAIDLTDPDWKMMALPYLVSLHASAVTCSQHVPNIPEELWEAIESAGKAQTGHLYSEKEWPIDGGVLLCRKPAESDKPKPRELLLTGHEDGTVRFWNASDVALTPLYKYNSSILFTGEHLDVLEQPPEDEEDEWPPFRKVGTFDPYSDDPRLAVKKVLLCPLSSTLVIAGTAGHVITAKISAEAINKEIKSVTMNVVNDRDGFVWKGHEHLPARTASISFAVGFQPHCLLQLYPPAAVTALAMHSEWGLLAAGTAHGLAVFDYVRIKAISVKCTLNPNDLSGAGDTPISRRKSFKKSLRESFRRLRKGRSQRRATTATGSPPRPATAPEAKKKDAPSIASSPSGDAPIDVKPVERQVEARPVDDASGSMVRCLYFARSYIISMQNTTPTLWAGTNNGTVYVFTLAIPAGVRRTEEDVNCTLGKEIQLKHRAPVIAITILDGSNIPLPEPFEAERGVCPGPDMASPHRVVIASEEQFKIFNLPSLKPFCKYKLTAHEGSRVRKTGFAKFTCPVEPSGQHEETCLLCLTNLGECLVLGIPELRRQLNAATIKREDINGISSLTFTKAGEALYLHSSSELQRISLSAAKMTKAHCALNLPPNARSTPEVATPEQKDTSTTEPEEKNEEATNEEVVVEEKGVNQTQALPKVITENGVVGSTNGEESPKEPSLRPAASTTDVNGDDDRQDLSSLGDITIDSVKDHLLNSSLFRNATSSEDLHNRLAGLKMEVTSRTSEISTQNQSVVVKTTTVISQQASTNGITTNGDVETQTTQQNACEQVNSTTVEREISSGTETTTTHATITLPPNVEISAADLANLECTTTTVITEKTKAPLAKPEEVGS
ncbi:lethal(2) giant larvae protein homolog 1 isoform X3 [Nasonia vitripennis]|uniref:Lethal giant larvae homologue 2 domain-containing protein n=1 Tax=Nasonia vitripennis TaxID=7425 RepID=A0A7M7QSR7_NASVI|nr:lethal(2) giant larvae protein homolog 1 isoform X3 [Nasonia vitripennis]XP_032453966.1 lethal(2) giant larvae protein homolog 1 isoform X3 [Nasonia vitripennis]